MGRFMLILEPFSDPGLGPADGEICPFFFFFEEIRVWIRGTCVCGWEIGWRKFEISGLVGGWWI